MQDKIEYALLQSKYRDMFKNQKNIFPKEWYNILEYELKKKILKDCLERNVLIVDSRYYALFRMKALNV